MVSLCRGLAFGEILDLLIRKYEKCAGQCVFGSSIIYRNMPPHPRTTLQKKIKEKEKDFRSSSLSSLLAKRERVERCLMPTFLRPTAQSGSTVASYHTGSSAGQAGRQCRQPSVLRRAPAGAQRGLSAASRAPPRKDESLLHHQAPTNPGPNSRQCHLTPR